MFLKHRELNNYETVIVIDKSINIKKILIKINLIKEETLLIIIWDKKLFEIIKKKNNNKKIVVELFSWNIFQDKYYLRWQSHEQSFNNLDKEFQNIKKNNFNLYNFIKKIYQSDKINYALKKNILIDSQLKFEKERIISNLKIFRPDLKIFINQKSLSYLTVKNLLIKTLLNLKYISVYFFYGIYAILKTSLKKRKINLNKVAIRLYGNSYKISKSHNSLDWVNDNNKINYEDINIVIEEKINKNEILEIEKKQYKYNFCIKSKPIQFFDYSLILSIIFKIYPGIIFNFFNYLRSPLSLKKTINSAIINKIIWTNFVNYNHPKVFLSYHNYQNDHIFRNIILEKIDCKSITFKHTQGENIYDTRGTYNNVIQGFNYNEREFLWGKSSFAMSKNDRNKSKTLKIIPPIWSSSEIRNFSKHNLNLNFDQKDCISVFTSALNVGQKNIHNVNSIYDHVNFLLFFIEFLKKNAKWILLFKSKYKVEEVIKNPIMLKVINELKASGRFYIFDHISRASTVYENSKIVISMPFTSVVIEALCAGKKSFFLDINGRFKYSYYNKFPDLIANSKKEGFKIFDKWNNMNNSDFKIYQNILNDEFDSDMLENATESVRNDIINIIK